MKIKVKQNKSFFTDFAKKYKEEYIDLLNETIQNIETEATTIAPVDLGILKASINGEVDGLNGVVGSTVRYAPYIEFGTGGLVDVPEGLEDYAMKFKGAGIKQVNLFPRPFLIPAFKKHTTIMLAELEKLDLNGIK
jgi:hypothetical protein